MGGGLADQLYYLNKIMNGVDWYWEIKLPEHFAAEHPVGTVLGRADYGDYFCVYQGVTVGGNRDKDAIFYPVIGKYVTLYANSSLIGNCRIGNQVILSANAFVKDEDIPDRSIVFGSSPHLSVKRCDQKTIEEYISPIWNIKQ